MVNVRRLFIVDYRVYLFLREVLLCDKEGVSKFWYTLFSYPGVNDV